jgi:hypothetical protein
MGQGLWGGWRGALAAVILVAGPAGPAVADCINDVWADPQAPFDDYATLFPNWVRVPAASFELWEMDDTSASWCTDGPIVGVTILNYGNATGGAGGDLTNVYFSIYCGSTNSAVTVMTFAGNWNVGGPVYPVWTWAGSMPWAADPCAAPATGCLCFPSLFVYADVGSCPTNGATVQLGPGWDPMYVGTGVTDDCDCGGPWGPTPDANIKTIRYVVKQADVDHAAPGDTITYTIWYGVNVFTLCRRFRQEHGLPPLAWHRQLKIGRAIELLRGSRLPVKVIAAQVGYPDLSQFGRAVRAMTGVSPRALRAAAG